MGPTEDGVVLDPGPRAAADAVVPSDAAAVRAALARAVAAAAERWPRARPSGLSAAEVRTRLRWLAECAADAPAADEAPATHAASSIPVGRLAEALRRAFVQELSRETDPPDVRLVLPVLARLDALAAAAERDAGQRLVGRPSGADALELLVEVAHDMRSPLSAILFLMDALRRSLAGVVSPAHDRQLSLVYGAAFGLSSLANDVIELARGGDRLVDRAPEPFSVAEVMRAVHDIVLPMAEERGLAVVMTPLKGDARVGHAAALQRVLLNLVTNAIKFTPSGSVTVEARPLSRTRVAFSVRDTGRGVPRDVVATLFDPFRPVPQRGEYAFSSAGLGLSICRKLVGAMGGRLEVETVEGAGTRFFFEVELPTAPRISSPQRPH